MHLLRVLRASLEIGRHGTAGGKEGHFGQSSRQNSPALAALSCPSLSLEHLLSSHQSSLLKSGCSSILCLPPLSHSMQTPKRPICIAFCLSLRDVSSPLLSWLRAHCLDSGSKELSTSLKEKLDKFEKLWGFP